MPDWIRSIGKTACALLIDTRNDDLAMLEKQMSTIAASLKQFKVWHVRKAGRVSDQTDESGGECGVVWCGVMAA
jgi:hypothetical protein